MIEEIDKQLKIINEKAIIIKKKFDFVKNSIINLVNSDKDVLIGKINCKSFFTDKLNLIHKLKMEFNNLKMFIQNLNEKRIDLNNKKMAIINLNYIEDERKKQAIKFRNSIFEFYKEVLIFEFSTLLYL